MQRSLLIYQNSVKSEDTAKQYTYYLDKFRDIYKIKDYDSLIAIDPTKSQIMVEDYVMSLKKNVNPNSVPTYIYPLKTFYEANDIVLNWRKIKKLFPALQKKSGREAYTTESINKILEHTPELRNRALIHFLASSGVRIGALPELKVRHLTRVKDCYVVVVYEDSIEEYHTFLIPEAAETLDRYFAKRQSDGEQFNSNTPVFRHRYVFGSTGIRHMTRKAMQSVVERGLKKAGLRNKADRKNQRYPVQLDHGFRKRFITTLKSINDIPVAYTERLAGHKVYTDELGNKIQLDESYLRPELAKLFSFFKLAIPELTLDQTNKLKLENELQQKKISVLQEKSLDVSELKNRINAEEMRTNDLENLLIDLMTKYQHKKEKQLLENPNPKAQSDPTLANVG